VLYQLLISGAMKSLSPETLFTLLEEMEVSKDNLDTDGKILSDGAQRVFKDTPLHAFSSSGWSSADAAAAAGFWHVGQEIYTKLGLQTNAPHLLVNGRVSHKKVNE
jgi:hypothetical protein